MEELSFKEGDIVVRTESHFANIRKGAICCVTMICENAKGSIKLKEARSYEASYSQSSFRHATQKEIDAYYKGCRNIEDLKTFTPIEFLLTKIL